MNETKHTLGPWTIEEVSFHPHRHVMAGARCVAAIADHHDSQDDKDARLIATAPALLNALMVAVIHLEDIAAGKATKASDYDMAYINAAIAKARGQNELSTKSVNAEHLVPTASYGLLESVGQGRTDVDQSDGDDAYFELCAEIYGGKYQKVFTGHQSNRVD